MLKINFPWVKHSVQSTEAAEAGAAACFLNEHTDYTVSIVFTAIPQLKREREWEIRERDMILFGPSAGADVDGEACFCDGYSDKQLIEFATQKGFGPSHKYQKVLAL